MRSAEEQAERVDWGRRLVVGGAAVVGLVLAWLVVAATVPRWWAQRVGDQVGGSITQGVFVGLFYGFVFTIVPLTILVLLLWWRRTPRVVLAGVVAAIVLALPNLMTLGIVLGTGNAAHAGDRILDVEAPAFRGASLAGSLLAAVLVLGGAYLVVSRRRAHADARRARARTPREDGSVQRSR